MRFLTFIESLRPPSSRYGIPIYGDWPFVCEEMRAATRKVLGGEAASSSGPVSHCHIAHDKRGYNR
jgi:hypothetical protein